MVNLHHIQVLALAWAWMKCNRFNCMESMESMRCWLLGSWCLLSDYTNGIGCNANDSTEWNRCEILASGLDKMPLGRGLWTKSMKPSGKDACLNSCSHARLETCLLKL